MAARTGTARWAVLRTLGMALRAATRPGAPSVAARLAALPRMTRAALSGEFAGLSRGRLLAMLGALLYVVSPVDLVPEALFSVFGIADDAMLVGWLAAALVNHTEEFLAWERGRSRPAAGGPQDPPAGSPGPWSDTVTSHVVR